MDKEQLKQAVERLSLSAERRYVADPQDDDNFFFGQVMAYRLVLSLINGRSINQSSQEIKNEINNKV